MFQAKVHKFSTVLIYVSATKGQSNSQIWQGMANALSYCLWRWVTAHLGKVKMPGLCYVSTYMAYGVWSV